MLKVGITGGIGSGKSVVCRVFSTLGIPVFNADEAARFVMEHEPGVVAAIKALLGNDVYEQGELQRPRVSSLVFGKPEVLQRLNDIVHPATITFGRQWMERQRAPYIIKEAAIFFESGSYHDMDVMIGVHAPQELRLARAMQRSGQTREQIATIVASQMNEEEKMKRCDYVIANDDVLAVLPQVMKLHETLLAKANTAAEI